MVNGANVEEGKNNGTSIIPNLDSIEEFRIITNNFDAEYGNYSGGQVNVVTKSGTNSLHGSVFEFNRNTAFNARNYFNMPTDQDPNPKAAKLIQNQFGATVGGPIKRDKLFFFADYQGTRRIFAPTQTAFCSRRIIRRSYTHRTIGLRTFSHGICEISREEPPSRDSNWRTIFPQLSLTR